MAHSTPNLILTLLLLNTACPAAGASVMRVHSSGEVEMMQTESVTGLANMFSDDLEAKAMTSKLLEGTPSDDLLPFVQKLKEQIQPWHDKSTATLKAAMEEIASCTASMENGMRETEAKMDSCSAKSTSHTTHRTDESTKHDDKEHWKAETAEKKEVMTTECNIFQAVEDEAKAATASYGGGDEGAYLESVSAKFCKDLLPRYKEHKEKCTTATAEHVRVSEIYETKNTAYTVQKTTSDTVQTEMDVTCCEYSLATKDVCTSHDTCYEDKVAAYKAVEAIVKAEEKVKKTEWRVYSRIECLLPVLGTDQASKIEECRAKTHDTSHLDIDYPAIPDKATCHVDETFPGTDAYDATKFGNLPDNAKGKTVAKCTGMMGDASPKEPTGPLKLGCFIDDGNRAFAGGSVRLGKDSNTVSKCAEHCSGNAYMAVQDGDECFCGDSYKTAAPYVKVDDSQCSKNSACGVQHGCGEAWKNTIYKLPSTGAEWLEMAGMATTQSSDSHNSPASRAVDGNSDTNWGGNSCTHTHNEANPWWNVDFGATKAIEKVEVTNRADCCGERLNGFYVYADAVECASNVQISQGETKAVACRASARNLKIQVKKTEWFTLCEVKVKAS